MRRFITWIFKLLAPCPHDYRWRRNIYGDEIIMAGYNRSWWVCIRCGKWQSRPSLEPDGFAPAAAVPPPEATP